MDKITGLRMVFQKHLWINSCRVQSPKIYLYIRYLFVRDIIIIYNNIARKQEEFINL